MLLRRITQHVKDQNWFAVFIDFIIVVVGVFIGIQVANWNEELAERVLEQQYLERIYFDTERLITDIEDGLEWSEDQKASQVVVLNSFRSGVLRPQDKAIFERGLAFFGYSPIHTRESLAVQELKSSGRMAIISDIELRELIGLVEQRLSTTKEHALHMKENRRKHLSEVSSHWQFIESDFKPKGITKIQYDFDTLANNQEFINRLSQMRAMFQIQRRNAKNDQDDIRQLQKAVVEVLGYTPQRKNNQ
ncbi:hypothetical protein [Kangiella sp. TOML190]|uniref:hypothetical protein n=1 Tax=Kangiella sp. TOML190 TaxID=2931351 RepID=UPI0020412435|nr:hypothetical protein [Kangiella sp. TOML190]